MDSDVQAGRSPLLHADKTSLDTPAMLVDLRALDENIARIAGTCRQHGIDWRPHTKGIKVPQIAHRWIEAGAIGITCAKLGEAEVMGAAGIKDILIANQVVGPQKIARLVALRPRCDVIVSVDDRDNVTALADAARAAGVVLRVVIEVNIGMNRAGVEPGEPCVALAKFIAGQKGVQFAGLMGWEGHAAPIPDTEAKSKAVSAAVRAIVQSAEMCRAAGVPVAIVSCGGTGTYWLSAAQPGVTEIQAGGGVFSDVHYRKDFGIDHPYALTIMTSVTSRPTPTRVICDAGKKTMSSDASMPEPIGLDHVRSARLSAEHATIERRAQFKPARRRSSRMGCRLLGYDRASARRDLCGQRRAHRSRLADCRTRQAAIAPDCRLRRHPNAERTGAMRTRPALPSADDW